VDRLMAREGRYVTRTWHIPAARFDNRNDLTTFVRAPREAWKAEDVAAIHNGLKETFRQFGR